MLIYLQFKREQLYQESIKGFVYSVKLKLELNILSKLVDLVHGGSANRSMTLDVIDSRALPGQAQKNVQRELSGQEYFGSLFTSDTKDHVQHVENSHVIERRSNSSISPSTTDEYDAVMRIRSQQSRYSARTSDRESDILYADVLRSIS